MDRESLYEERFRSLPEWSEAMEEDVVSIGELLELESPEELLEDPRVGLADLDSMYEYEEPTELSEEEFNDIFSLLLAYVSVYLIRKFDGRWVVDSERDSPSYARYLVALPAGRGESEVRIDVGEEVNAYLHELTGRSLLQLVIRLEGKVAL
ncbi:hypothetical protein [Streptomyces chartreusis]|uniref:hypothetical protein n=1 Tax=Streptomyces chartreusis TaxID=1969 RepID=UPI002E821275|nr:hypothetical protein [Streptomyces chartreusis]WUB23796.1 hypothetical protein OG997_44460 [Streptomyces chartreusis]